MRCCLTLTETIGPSRSVLSTLAGISSPGLQALSTGESFADDVRVPGIEPGIPCLQICAFCCWVAALAWNGLTWYMTVPYVHFDISSTCTETWVLRKQKYIAFYMPFLLRISYILRLLCISIWNDNPIEGYSFLTGSLRRLFVFPKICSIYARFTKLCKWKTCFFGGKKETLPT